MYIETAGGGYTGLDQLHAGVHDYDGDGVPAPLLRLPGPLPPRPQVQGETGGDLYHLTLNKCNKIMFW